MIDDFEITEKEILVLTSDRNCRASKMIDSWVSAQYFLAYFDLQTNELIEGEGLFRIKTLMNLVVIIRIFSKQKRFII